MPKRTFFRARNVVVLVLLAAAATAAWVWTRPAGPTTIAGRMTHTVETGDIDDVLLVTGLVKPAVTIELRSEASGLVESVSVKEGDRVVPGQELLRLDSRVAQTAVQEAEANLKQAEMQQAASVLDIDEDTLALRRKVLDRTRDLLEKGLVSRTEYETRELEVKVAERTLERAKRNIETNRARIDQLKAAVERAQAQLQNTIIRSPLDAWVIRRHVEVGSGVAGLSQSSTGGTVVITLGDAREASLEAKVTAGDARRLTVGLAARIRLDSQPDRVHDGRVTSVASAGEQDTQTRLTTFPVLMSVEVDDEASWINVPAQAEIVIETRNDVVIAPEGCVRTDPGGSTTVNVGTPDNFTPKVVELGAVEQDRIEVKSGLSAGEVIVCR